MKTASQNYMDSLEDTIWDVVLTDTGLSQSLIALALSRSGKKVLHLDRKDYYGGAEAALSLQEAETWAAHTREEPRSPFGQAVVVKPEQDANVPTKLGFPRAYSLSLSPQLIYTRSNILPALISSRVYRQLEFLAIGSWWTYNGVDTRNEEGKEADASSTMSGLRRIPGGREDVFADTEMDLRSTRSLMKFLKFAADSDAHPAITEVWGQRPFSEFLTSHFKIQQDLQAPLLALTLSPESPTNTPTAYALPRINRHLTSIGLFGPGFGSVLPKWGGLAEIAQVACRAGAVGGGVYVLKKGIDKVMEADAINPGDSGVDNKEASAPLRIVLDDGLILKACWLVKSNDIERPIPQGPQSESQAAERSITIIASPLAQLFPSPAEGAPPPAGAMVVFPSGSLNPHEESYPPVYLMIHSSDTGECPSGQCIVYAQTLQIPGYDARSALSLGINKLLTSLAEDTSSVLWTLHYEYRLPVDDQTSDAQGDHVITLPAVQPSLVLEDDVLRHVRAAWEKITGEEDGTGFMMFEDRDGVGPGEGEEENRDDSV